MTRLHAIARRSGRLPVSAQSAARPGLERQRADRRGRDDSRDCGDGEGGSSHPAAARCRSGWRIAFRSRSHAAIPSTMSGSNLVPASWWSSSRALSNGSVPVSSSSAWAAARIRAPIGMSAPGQPVRAAGAVPPLVSVAEDADPRPVEERQRRERLVVGVVEQEGPLEARIVGERRLDLECQPHRVRGDPLRVLTGHVRPHAHHPLEEGEKLERVERLAEERARAGRVGQRLGLRGAADHDDRRLARPGAVSEPLGVEEAVDAGKADVEDDRVGHVLEDQLLRLDHMPGVAHLDPLELQRRAD